MSYSFLGADDPCAHLSFFERWFTPACKIEELEAAEGSGVSSGMFTGVSVGGHSYSCSGDPAFPKFKCASWAVAQGLTNAYHVPLVISVMGEERTLQPGGISPSGVVATDSSREQSIANALALRPGASGTIAGVAVAIAAGAVLLGTATYFVTRKKKRKGRRR